jgi:hypothetical protein
VSSRGVKTLRALLEFIYIVREDEHDEDALDNLDDARERFELHREIFREMGARPTGFNLPRQHAMKHYRRAIEMWGSPNGLCTSLTESRHKTAVKQPWRRSNGNDPLDQMMLNNQRMDKMSACHAFFAVNGLLRGTCLWDTMRSLGILNDEEAREPPPRDEDPPSAHMAQAAGIQPQDHDEENGEDAVPLDGPRIADHVELARTHGKRGRTRPRSILFSIFYSA